MPNIRRLRVAVSFFPLQLATMIPSYFTTWSKHNSGKKDKIQKSQNYVKAAIAFVCTTCKRQLLFALLQLITFVCTTAIENILSTTPIVNFCMPYCNCQHFYGTTTFVWTIATITINITLLQLLTFKCTMVIDNFLCTIAIDYFCMHYCNWQLLFGLLLVLFNPKFS